MREHRRALGAEWVKMGRPALRARTGINSGPMLVGNLGSKYRFAYGVLGDQVNLGSRLEGLNKMYGSEILIGENTERLVKDEFLLRKIDVVRVKGRAQCVDVFELVSENGQVIPQLHQEALKEYAAGYAAYCDQHWDDAIGLFGKALELIPDDGPSRAMAARCRMYRETPPPEGWDCVYEPETK
jgi:adenylate cyclase